jgi:pimeloyl-ACP methyl ester carboxylesterase
VQYVVTRAGRVGYTDGGSGPPIVLLHATLHDHRDFDAIAPALREDYRVIAVDWPGHGASDAASPSQPVTAMVLADVLEDVVAALDLPRCALIGNSVGGYAASRLAITQPARVAALVLVNAAGFTPNNPANRTFCRAMGTPAITRRLLPRLVPRYMKPGNELDAAITARTVARAKTPDGIAVAASLWRSFADPAYDLRARASDHTAPTMFVWGARDVVLPTRAGRAAHRLLPSTQFETLETGHVPFASDPAGFLALVAPFLSASLAAPTHPNRPVDG